MHQYAKGDHGTGMETSGFGRSIYAGFRMSIVCCWWATMKKRYYFNDPYDNNGVIGYRKRTCRKKACCTAQYGNRNSNDDIKQNFIKTLFEE